MVIWYTTEEGESGAFLRRVLEKNNGTSRLTRTSSGKPYLEGGEFEFNLTHTQGLVAVAVSHQAVGIDAEAIRPRKIGVLFSRLTPAEREEDFFELWTAKEAYVKYRGGTLHEFLPLLRYEKGVLSFKDAPQDVFLRHFPLEGCLLCVCTAEAEEVIFKKC